MTMKQEEALALAEQLAASMGIRRGPVRPRLRTVQSDPPGASGHLTALQRDVLYKRIRDLGRMYSLMWLARQETAHVNGIIECLADDELVSLLEKTERARECRIEGIAFDEVGLVRDTIGEWR
ncbi:hypothetical protein ACULML_17735 [Xanthomonas arboricola pv. corylina]